MSKSAQGSWSIPSFLSLSGLGSRPPTAKHRQYKNRKWCTGKKRSPPAWACLYCSHCNAPEMHPSITPVSSVAGNRSYCWCHIPLSLTIKWLVTAYLTEWLTLDLSFSMPRAITGSSWSSDHSQEGQHSYFFVSHKAADQSFQWTNKSNHPRTSPAFPPQICPLSQPFAILAVHYILCV